MNEDHPHPEGSRRRRLGWAVGLVAGGALAGGLMAATLPAVASTTTAPSAVATTQASGLADRHPGGQPCPRAGETPLTGTDAEKATAAALAAVPGATIDRVETDADGAVSEAHVTRTDGTKATIKFDKDFTVTGIEAGMGTGPGAPKPDAPK